MEAQRRILDSDEQDADIGSDGADLLFVGLSYQEAAVSVAEYLNIPLATLHHVPVRANGELLPILPAAPRPSGDDGVRLAGLAPEQASRANAAP